MSTVNVETDEVKTERALKYLEQRRAAHAVAQAHIMWAVSVINAASEPIHHPINNFVAESGFNETELYQMLNAMPHDARSVVGVVSQTSLINDLKSYVSDLEKLIELLAKGSEYIRVSRVLQDKLNPPVSDPDVVEPWWSSTTTDYALIQAALKEL